MIEDDELKIMQLMGQVYDCSKFDSCGRHCPYFVLGDSNRCRLKEDISKVKIQPNQNNNI